ncbi:hypothetical protein [Haloferula rosea]|uniref:PEP-CTERM sorting domain-containing protein n=1 Tax=Haloferula rosea TaxID=490093 RepID=A0A934RB54_9BACT|nr:hypothetical protein [Haloferula rosea]MBK1826104.1 hypothetical protein [Haloferula rosea]
MKALLVLALVSLPGVSLSAVTFSVDSTSSLIGSFTFDLVNDGGGVGQTIANFPHFYADFSNNGFYPSGQSEFEVNDIAAPTIVLRGEDIEFGGIFTASASLDSTGLPASYPDVTSTFTSPFDGQTIEYTYSNLGFTGPVLSGDFSFNVVPEPSAALLSALALSVSLRRKRS